MTQYKGQHRIESTRLSGWDYRNAGWYFITICTRDGCAFFGDVVDDSMRLSALGEAASRFWLEIPTHIPTVDTDAFVVMPNHIHGILAIESSPASPTVETLPVETLHTCPALPLGRRKGATSLHVRSRPISALPPKVGSLGAIVRSYKSAVTNWAKLNGFARFAWQPRYWDHIIRHERSLVAIRRYICDNPLRWTLDRENPLGSRM
jgi:putative transposase